MTLAQRHIAASLCMNMAEQLKRAALALGDAATLTAAESARIFAADAKARASRALRTASAAR